MRKIIWFFLAFFSASTHAGDTMKDPELLVKSFISDYVKWNLEAYELSKKHDPELKFLDIAEKEYEKILSRYCPSGLKHQPIAFGSDPDHDTVNEEVLKVKINGDKATVFTKHKKFMYNTDLSTEYEYHLIQKAGEWRLVSVLYVVDGRKYEGL